MGTNGSKISTQIPSWTKCSVKKRFHWAEFQRRRAFVKSEPIIEQLFDVEELPKCDEDKCCFVDSDSLEEMAVWDFLLDSCGV
jgi:hypothetical protein